MQQPLQITIKDIEHTPAIEAHIHSKAEKLSQYFEDIISCHVLIEQTQKHQHQGKLHNVHIKIHVPGKELAVNHNESENLWIAIRDAFDSMRDQLNSYRDQIRHHVKSHPELVHGEVVRLFDDFGFILGTDGLTEYYFNSSNVVSHRFQRLKIGIGVQFIEDSDGEGPQAKRVSLRNQLSHGKLRNIG